MYLRLEQDESVSQAEVTKALPNICYTSNVNLTDIYRQVILEHSQHPRNKGELENATMYQRGHNPSCGDELELHLRIEAGIIVKAKFTGVGCAISQASASLMTVLLEGQTVGTALELTKDFHTMMKGETPAESLGDAAALRGVAKLHARVKCASLAWQTLKVMLEPTEKI